MYLTKIMLLIISETRKKKIAIYLLNLIQKNGFDLKTSLSFIQPLDKKSSHFYKKRKKIPFKTVFKTKSDERKRCSVHRPSVIRMECFSKVLES